VNAFARNSARGHSVPNVNGGTVSRSWSCSNMIPESIRAFHAGSSAEFSQSTVPRCPFQQLDVVQLPSGLTQIKHWPTSRSTSTLSEMMFTPSTTVSPPTKPSQLATTLRTSTPTTALVPCSPCSQEQLCRALYTRDASDPGVGVTAISLPSFK